VQPFVTPVRSHLSAGQVVELIQDSPSLIVSSGLEIIDLSLNVLEDISDDLAGGSIARNSYADLHAAATLNVTRQLDWGADIVRPYYVLDNGTVSARFNLGAYHINTPAWSLAETPATFDVTGYDMLLRLAQPVGDAFSISTGANYLEVIEGILVQRGYTAYVIDQDRATTVAPSTRAWAFDESITWLTIVNDLLASIGYQGIWADWDGRLRCQPYLLPTDREAEWYYSDDPDTTMLSTEREYARDFFEAPNRWVYYRTNSAEDDPPVEGDGIYTYQNDNVGDTSVQARNGLVITRVVGADAADQAALIAQANIGITADMTIPTLINVKTSPNPLHWHFDRLMLQDDAASRVADVQCTSWSLALAPSTEDMQQSWTVIAS
jgi:hypothetical protein